MKVRKERVENADRENEHLEEKATIIINI